MVGPPRRKPSREPLLQWRWVGLADHFRRPARCSRAAQRRIRLLKQFFFVSYDRDDGALVAEILALPDLCRFRFWVDHVNLKIGARWSADIVEAIRASSAVVVFCSKESGASNDVMREVSIAARYQRPILPVMLDNAPIPDGLLYYLSIHQLLRTDVPGWEQQLAATLEQLDPRTRPWPAPVTSVRGQPENQSRV